MKASDLFVSCLEAEGVERIFGDPGEENADLMISLIDSQIEFVLCRHEQAAAFMADAYGRLTGKAFAQNGPAALAVPVDYGENRKLTERLGNIVCPI
jgi:thiamine pyrophosphate-dependent acetolactate synthase large subunit-like protein